MKTRVLLCDDHAVVLEGAQTALSKYDDVEIVALCSNGREAVEQVETLEPHVVVMDIAMPHFNGIEATHQIKRRYPQIKVVIFTMHSYREFLVDLIKAGISGYVLKDGPILDLYWAIKVVRRGGTFFSEDVSSFFAKLVEKTLHGMEERDRFDMLSVREREVFQLIADGRSVKETGDILCISPKTVETHKYHIMEKLQLRSTSAWTKEAIRRGVVLI